MMHQIKLIFFFIFLMVMFVTVAVGNVQSDNQYISSETVTKVENLQQEKSIFSNYNKLYQLIDKAEFLVTPLAGAIAGAVRCGSWCFAAGGLVGIIDEVAIYFGYTDKRYLTWGIFGGVTFHVMKPGVLSDIAGVAIGILLPTGALWSQKHIFHPMVSTVAGNVVAGPLGSITGSALGVLDEVLIDNGITDKHYMTLGVTGMAVVNLLGWMNPIISSFVGSVLGMVAARYEEDLTINFLAPIKIADELYGFYSKFIAKEHLDVHIERQAISLIGGQFLAQVLLIKMNNYQQDLTYNFERLDGANNQAWGNFKIGMTNIAIFLFPYVIGGLFSGTIDHYFGKKLEFTLEDKIKAKLFSGENFLHLSQNNSNTVLLDNLQADTSEIVGTSNSLMTQAISSTIDGAYGVGIVIVTSPNLFVFSVLYDQACSFISKNIMKRHSEHLREIKSLNSDLVSVFKHDAANIRTITERDGVGVSEKKIRQITAELRAQEGEQKLWGMVSNMWRALSGAADFMFSYYLIGNEINAGRLPFENRNRVRAANLQVSRFLSWSGKNAQNIAVLEQSMDRFVLLKTKIEESSSNLDLIAREFVAGDQLILQDLEIGVADRVLVVIKDLRLSMGKIYVITGATGSGKTSFLSKIKGIKENKIFGRGKIYYPKINGKAPKIVMLSQQDYFPLNCTLEEIICYPDAPENDRALNRSKREKIMQLLKEIGFTSFGDSKKTSDGNDMVQKYQIKADGLKLQSLAVAYDDSIFEQKRDWYTALSGGEKKKVMVVAAIIKQPDILILDEIFNGLDPESIIVVQKMLKKYLPNSLILLVDHHAQDNNSSNFYDQELHFFDKSIVVKELLV